MMKIDASKIKVDKWNNQYPRHQPVRVDVYGGIETKTVGRAFIFMDIACIQVSGGAIFDLDEVEPLEAVNNVKYLKRG